MASAPYERLELNNNAEIQNLRRGSPVLSETPLITKTEFVSSDDHLTSENTTSLFNKSHSRSTSASPGLTVRFRKKKVMKKPTEIRPKSLMVFNSLSTNKFTSGPDNTMSLIEALNDKKLRAGFRIFLDSEFSVENLDFWLSVEEFKKIKNVFTRREKMENIYEEFVSPGSRNQINLDHFTRQRVILHMANDSDPSVDTFNAAQRYVFNIMENDSYARFVRSKCYEICNSPGRRSPKQFFHDIFHGGKSRTRSISPKGRRSSENFNSNNNKRNINSRKTRHSFDDKVSMSEKYFLNHLTT